MKKEQESRSLFISSTFRDMQAERDIMRDVVLPRVNEFASQYGAQVELIDLRWGVDTADIDENEQSQKVLRTCLDEIERSRPFFIGLLGDRYGWVPPERDMKDALDFVDYKAETIEQSVTALEIEYGALRSPKPPVCLFYFRHIEDYSPLCEKALPDYVDTGIAVERLAALKSRIKEKFGSSVKEYDAIIEDGEVSGLSAFAEMITEDIIASLREEWGDPPEEPPSDEEKETAIQKSFRRSRTEGFIGHEAAIEELREFCLGDGAQKVLLVAGESGSGKSTMLCKIIDEIENDCLLLQFSCGLSAISSKASSLLRMMIICLEEHIRATSVDIDDFVELKQRYKKLLGEVCQERRVVVIADALEKLASRGDKCDISWLTGGLPDNFRLLCSADLNYDMNSEITGSVIYVKGNIYEIPLMPDLDIIELIRKTAMRYHKQIPDAVVEHILKKTTATGEQAAQNPLYIKLLIQDLSMLDRHEFSAIDKYAAKGMSPMDAIIRFMIQRVDSVSPDAGQAFLSIAERIDKLIGADFVFHVLRLIAASRRGLREKDLEGAFHRMNKPYSSADFSWLRQMLPDMFVQGDAMQWNFAHEIARHTLCESNTLEISDDNTYLTEYFLDNLQGDKFVRQEIMYHLYLSKNAEAAAQLLHKAIDDIEISHNYYYINCLADIYTIQRDAVPISGIKIDEPDFLTEILHCAASLPDDNRWYAGAVYVHGLPDALPFDVPVRYRIGLIETALAIAGSVKDTSTDRFHFVLRCCMLLADLYTGESGNSKDTAIDYYLRAVDISESIYKNRAYQYSDLIELVKSLTKAVSALYEDDSKRDGEYFHRYRQRLGETALLLLERIDEWEDESIFDFLTVPLSAFTVLSKVHAEDIYGRALDSTVALAFKHIKEDARSFSHYGIYSALCKAGMQMGNLLEKAGNTKKAYSMYGGSAGIAYEAALKTRDDRYLSLAIDAELAETRILINGKKYKKAANNYYNIIYFQASLFPCNPTISNALSIYNICGEYAQSCASMKQREMAARIAVRQFLIAEKICEVYSNIFGASENFDITKAETYIRLAEQAEEMITKYPFPAKPLRNMGFNLIAEEEDMFKGAINWNIIDFNEVNNHDKQPTEPYASAGKMNET